VEGESIQDMKSLHLIRIGLLAFYLLGFIVNSFVNIPFLLEIRAVAALIFFGCSFRLLKPLNAKICFSLLCIGLCLLTLRENGFGFWGRAVVENAGIISLILMVPLLGLILRYAPYEEVIGNIATRYIRSEFGYYTTILLVVNLFSTLMSMAAVPFCYQLIRANATKYSKTILAKALSRGFCANMLWCPNFITVAVVLQYLNLSWNELAPTGFFFSLVALALALVIEKFSLTRSDENEVRDAAPQPVETELSQGELKYLYWLGLQILLVLLLVSFLSYSLGKNVFVTVPLVSLLFPLILALLLRKLPMFWDGIEKYLTTTLPGMANEFMLFSAVGFFGFALAGTTLAKSAIDNLLVYFSAYQSIIPLLIIWTVAGLSMIGIHPIITIPSLAICLADTTLGMSNIQLAIPLMTGYIIYLILSPVSSMSMLIAGLLGRSVFDVSVRINLTYSVALSISTVLILKLLA